MTQGCTGVNLSEGWAASKSANPAWGGGISITLC